MSRKLLQINLPDVVLYPSHVKTINGKLTITRYTEEPSRGLRLSEEDIDALIGWFLTNPMVIENNNDRVVVIADYDVIVPREEKNPN